MSSVSQSLQRLPLARLVIVFLLLLLMFLGAVPAYLGGKWPWQRSPQVTTLKQLRALRRQPLEVKGWQVVNHQVLAIGDHRWVVQEMLPLNAAATGSSVTSNSVQQSQIDSGKVALLLLPQNNNTHEPQVEWTDLKGAQRWKTDSLRQVFLPLGNDSKAQAEVQYLRAWNERQTYAVSQWYAWPNGGSPNPGRWFWADQGAQLGGNRLPWVAVSILIPIEPLGNIDQALPQAQSLNQAVQTALMSGPLK